MYQLEVYAYKEDIKKISFTRLIKEQADLSLSEAKRVLDLFLEGNRLLFSFKTKRALLSFKRKADLLGTRSRLETSVQKVYSSQEAKTSNSQSGYPELFILS